MHDVMTIGDGDEWYYHLLDEIRSNAMRKHNAWYFGNEAPIVGQEWDNHLSAQVEHVKTLAVLRNELVNGRNAYLCKVQVLSTESKPENIAKLR